MAGVAFLSFWAENLSREPYIERANASIASPPSLMIRKLNFDGGKAVNIFSTQNISVAQLIEKATFLKAAVNAQYSDRKSDFGSSLERDAI